MQTPLHAAGASLRWLALLAKRPMGRRLFASAGCALMRAGRYYHVTDARNGHEVSAMFVAMTTLRRSELEKTRC
jgi:hypothetical protein